MALLRLLSRTAFICNVSFLLAIGLMWFKHPVNPGVSSLIIVLGFFLSVILNLVVNVSMIYLRLAKKTVTDIPRWLMYVNGCFFIVQIIFFFK